ncbi:glycosyltransferase family 4 protein [Candidatus Parcubacteria bacterium]|nr:glycosyltransferase family 4 protein [Candidatus Parcubacteria bacterium]
MKIAIIGQKGIPSVSGGVETHVEELSVKLAKKGHEVYVYTRPNYTDKNLKEYKGVNLISLPSIPTKHLDAISHTFFACLDVLRRDVDIIHFHSIGPSFLIWLIKILKPKTPVAATFHTLCYQHKKWKPFARFSLKLGEHVCCNMADKVIAISNGLKDYVFKKYKKEAEYIPNGVNKSEFYKAEEIKRKWGLEKNSYIIIVSRLIQHKGIHYAIKAFKKINTDKKLVIVGDGFFTDTYTEELRALAVDDKRIIFTGSQNGNVLKELFSNAYAFIQPSESEGLSISLLEAMSYGLGVLVSDIPENLEPIEDTGFSFKNKNVDDLAKKINYIINHPEELKNKGALAKKRVEENYNWDVIVDRVLGVYQKAIKDKKGL